MTLPNFLVIGAAKAGTTSVYEYLGQHPQIFMSPAKETFYFLPESSYSVDFDTYQSLFDGVSKEVAIGEATPMYLHSPEACQRIKQLIPNAKLIAVLRNPVDRAYSNYLDRLYDGRESIADFHQACEAEKARRSTNIEAFAFYKSQGFYFAQLSHYLKAFDRSQLKILLFEDLKLEPEAFMQDIYRFLGVDADFTPDLTVRRNTAGKNRHFASSRKHEAILEKLRILKPITIRLIPDRLHRTAASKVGGLVRQNVSQKMPPLTAAVRAELISMYRDDILRLQDLINRDLSSWLR